MQLQNVIVMMGPPGSGKGTQSKLLVENLDSAYFSMGNTFRELGTQGTPLALEIKRIIDQGQLVPDNLTREVFQQGINRVMTKSNLVIDGFPRSLGQLEMLDEVLKKHDVKNFRVFFLDVDKVKLLKRLSLRKTCPNCQAIYLPGVPEYVTEICEVCGHKIAIREDDSNTTFVEKRFDEYMNKTAEVKKYYESKGLLTHIQGDQSDDAQESIKKIHEDILKQLGAQ